MRTKNYKTLRGLLKQTQQLTIEQLFSGRFCHNTKGWINFRLDEKAKREAADKFAKYLLSNKQRQNDLISALLDGSGELDYFQCFYIDYSKKYGVYCSNSLSGDAYNYCKRMYLKKYC